MNVPGKKIKNFANLVIVKIVKDILVENPDSPEAAMLNLVVEILVT